MSERFSGGFITKTPVVPTTSSASGIWTLDQQEQAQQAGIWPQQPSPQYIEDVFSTYLTTGTGTTQTVTNGIDLSTYGGMVWNKIRSTSANNYLMDSARNNFDQLLYSNTTDAGINLDFINPTTSGFNFVGAALNNSGETYANWTFRKQPKFFDVQTATVGASNTLTFSHFLGSIPGFIMVKTTANAGGWVCYHTSLGNNKILQLQSTAAAVTVTGAWTVSSTSVTLAGAIGTGEAVVAYLFAHNAGGFGATETENVISCGSFTTDVTTGNATINLGFEPQWILTKMADGLSDWTVYDNMRGMSLTNSYELFPNSSSSEVNYGSPDIIPSATGFSISYVSGSGQYGKNKTIVYMAIRRGPMKVPTDATKVFIPGRGTDAASTFITTGFPSDFSIQRWMGGADNNLFSDRLRGFSPANATASPYIVSNTTGAEVSATATNFGYTNTGFQIGSNSGGNWWALNFRRAPGFFDEVCYTGNGSARTVTHNLGVAPELMIVRNRPNSGGYNWTVYSSTTGPTKALYLNTTDSGQTYSGFWNDTAPTSSVFTVGVDAGVNGNTAAMVAYLFATCAGVSKVGTYTGNGTTQTINCGFVGGARFVLIKRTSATGDWYVYDTARGMTTLTDPYLLLNSTAAESATLGSITTVTTGFAVNSTILAAINLSGSTYTFLAIA